VVAVKHDPGSRHDAGVRGRYVIESLDAVPALTPAQEQGLEEALKELDRGEGADLEDVRADLDAIIRC
jgi:hypothetical protein